MGGCGISGGVGDMHGAYPGLLCDLRPEQSEGAMMRVVGESGPEWAEWICPECRSMRIRDDGVCYCDGSGEVVEPREIKSLVMMNSHQLRHVKIITHCAWFEELGARR